MLFYDSHNYIIIVFVFSLIVFLLPRADADSYPAVFRWWCEWMLAKMLCSRPVRQNVSNWRLSNRRISINCRTKRKIRYWSVNNRPIWPSISHSWPVWCRSAIALAVSWIYSAEWNVALFRSMPTNTKYTYNFLYCIHYSHRFDSQWFCHWSLCLCRITAKWYFVLGDCRRKYAIECSNIGFHQILCSTTGHVPYIQRCSSFTLG